ncbi:MAG: PaaI family thioesterase [Pseudomonadota bacterium]|jgi:uncharacterized protein (TIGR00369 family)
MSKYQVLLGPAELNAALAEAFPKGGRKFDLVREVTPGKVRLTQAYDPAMLRPGGLISGPTLMSLADTAGYVIVMAHVGVEFMAVTSALNMSFLRGAKPGDIQVEAELLSLGRRNVVCDVRLWTESPERLAAQAIVTYARAMPT